MIRVRKPARPQPLLLPSTQGRVVFATSSTTKAAHARNKTTPLVTMAIAMSFRRIERSLNDNKYMLSWSLRQVVSKNFPYFEQLGADLQARPPGRVQIQLKLDLFFFDEKAAAPALPYELIHARPKRRLSKTASLEEATRTTAPSTHNA